MSTAHGLRKACVVALLAPLVLILIGCGGATTSTDTTSVPATPEDVLSPAAPENAVDAEPTDAMPGQAESDTTAQEAFVSEEESVAGPPPSLVQPSDLSAGESVPARGTETTPPPDSSSADGANLVSMKFEEFTSKAVANPDAKLTMVDAWATWCGPCKENFPHLVEMHQKYADQGLKVVSLSFDDPFSDEAVSEARTFLESQDAEFPHVLLNEEFGVGFEQFDIGTIPAVFLYDPSGQEIRRFTYDDPNNQFNYEEVEQVVSTLLKGETLPEDAPGFVYKPRDDN